MNLATLNPVRLVRRPTQVEAIDTQTEPEVMVFSREDLRLISLCMQGYLLGKKQQARLAEIGYVLQVSPPDWIRFSDEHDPTI